MPNPESPSPVGQPLRIGLFSGNYNHIPDGVSLTLNRLVRYLEKRGHQVLVFAPTIADPPMEHAGELLPVPSVPIPGRGEYRISLGLTRLLKERLLAFNPDIVHVATPDVLGVAAARWASKHRVPLVSTYHTHFASYLQYYRLGWAEGTLWSFARRFYNQCRHVYVPSPTMADVLREHGVASELKIWARGVEPDRFDPSFRSTEWRKAKGFGEEEVVIAFVSRLVWEKGLDIYATVVRQLQARGLPVRALVVGDGPAGDGLQQRLPNAVFTGHLTGEELATAYASSEVFLFPSETETFGNVILEAMASGLPAICADAAGGRDLVDNGVTGLVCPPQNEAAFIEAARQLVEDAGMRNAMSKAATERSADFRWPVILGKIESYYREALYQ